MGRGAVTPPDEAAARSHGSSLPDGRFGANEVSRCAGLVLARVPTGSRRWAGQEPEVDGSGLKSCTVTQHVPWGLWFVFSLHCEDGGTLLWIFTTWYSVGP